MQYSLKKFAAALSSKALGFAVIFVIIGGMIGNLVDDIAVLSNGSSFSEIARLVIYGFIKALKLFSLGIPEAGVKENWILVVCRLVGSFVAMAALFKLLVTVFRQDVTSFVASFYRNHVVVLGYGTRNACFLTDFSGQRADRRPAVIVDNDPGKAKAFANLGKALFFQSDLSVSSAMTPANVAKAGLILIGAGSDQRNLALARSVVRARSAGAHGRIILTIDDAALAERCARDSDISRPANGDDLLVFNMATLIARNLLSRTPFSDLALAAGQDRVHLIFAGFSEVVQETIVQFLRISACHGLARPRIDIVASDGKSVINSLLGRAPNLGYAFHDPVRPANDEEPLAWAVDLRIHSGEPAALCYDEALIGAVTSTQGPTALVVATSDAAENVKIGLALKSAMRIDHRLTAPVYVRLTARSSLEALLMRYDRKGSVSAPAGPLGELRGTENVRDVLEPFGFLEDVCSMEAIGGERERLAKLLHEAYCLKRRGEVGSVEDVSCLPWQSLDETFRQANRRAADHLPVKFISIGIENWNPQQKNDALALAIADAATLESMARLEHASWRIDRELDGWRHGAERDNRRLLHPDLVPYDQLSERSKSYDREMIQVAAAAVR